MTDPLLDHVVLAGPDLAGLVAEFTERTGVEPKAGGRHPGGTRNYLVRVSETAYLEIIGPDDPNPDAPRPKAFGIDKLTAPRVVTFLVHPADIEKTIADAHAAGYDPGELGPLSRQTPDGDLLQWRLTRDAPDNWGGLAPGLIDWFDTPHPTTSGLPDAKIVSLIGRHPDPDGVQKVLAALGASLDVEQANEPGLTLVLDTPQGRVALW